MLIKYSSYIRAFNHYALGIKMSSLFKYEENIKIFIKLLLLLQQTIVEWFEMERKYKEKMPIIKSLYTGMKGKATIW